MAPIAHLDVDAFYASVELQRRPELRGLPVIVSGSGPRAVVTTASYEARKFGIGSAMPTARARRLCPDAVLVAPDFDAYRAASRKVMERVRAQVERVEVVGLDEAYLDLDGLLSPRAAMRRLVEEIRAETGLDCSIGIGPNRLVAKVASDAEKPRGFVVLTREQACERFGSHLAGARAGDRAEDRGAPRAACGITTLAALAAAPPEALVAEFGGNHGPDLQRRGRFEGSAVLTLGARRGVGVARDDVRRRHRRPGAPRGDPHRPHRRSSASGSSRRSAAGATSRSRCAWPTSRPSPARARSAPSRTTRGRRGRRGRAAARVRAGAAGAPARRARRRVRDRRGRRAARRPARAAVVASTSMPTLTVNDTELYYERRGAGEPLLLDPGHDRPQPALGRGVALRARARLRARPLRPPRRRAQRAVRVAVHDRRPRRRRGRAARRPGRRARARARHLDGRHGRPGARARGARARADADARLHVLRRAALERFTEDRVVNDLALAILSGDADRKMRTGLGVQRLAGVRRRRRATSSASCEVAVAYPVALEMVMAQVQAIIAHDTSARLGEIAAPTLVVHGTADQMLVRGQRRARRRASSRTRAWSCSTASVTCSSGSSPSASRSSSPSTRRRPGGVARRASVSTARRPSCVASRGRAGARRRARRGSRR